MKPIENIPQLYIFERPIETEIGVAYPIMMKDYPEFIRYYEVFEYDKPTLLIHLNKEALQERKNGNEVGFEINKLLYEECAKRTLYEIIRDSANPDHGLHGFKRMYYNTKGLFNMCFKEDVFHKINSQEELAEYLKFIAEMNAIQYEEPTTNPDIIRDRKAQRFLAEASGNNLTLESKITSVYVVTGEDPMKMSMYKFNKLFDRIAHIKNHDRAVLYSTIDTKIKVPPWFRHEFEEEARATLSSEMLERARNSQQYTNKL